MMILDIVQMGCARSIRKCNPSLQLPLAARPNWCPVTRVLGVHSVQQRDGSALPRGYVFYGWIARQKTCARTQMA